MSENGTYVTRAELKATVEPMREDISEIKTDVKTLLTARAGQAALNRFAARVGTAAVALSAGAVGAILAHIL